MLSRKIAVDLDGTVVNTYGLKFCRIASETTGRRIVPSQLTDYNFTKCTPLKLENLVDIFARKGFYKGLKPLPLAVEGLNLLYDEGFELHHITVRPSVPHVRAETVQWLAKYHVPFNSIHILTHAEGGAGKARVAKALGLNYFAEDNPDYTNYLAGVTARGFLVNARYNRNYRIPDNVERVDNLMQMAHILLA